MYIYIYIFIAATNLYKYKHKEQQTPRLAMAGLLRLSTAGGSFGGTFAKHNVLGCEADPKAATIER